MCPESTAAWVPMIVSRIMMSPGSDLTAMLLLWYDRVHVKVCQNTVLTPLQVSLTGVLQTQTKPEQTLSQTQGTPTRSWSGVFWSSLEFPEVLWSSLEFPVWPCYLFPFCFLCVLSFILRLLCFPLGPSSCPLWTFCICHFITSSLITF